MLNAEFFGAGMNLQMTTDLVMFHRFKPEMEEQIVGRAQRLGRKESLNVYYLLHDNESDEIENKFKFEDQGSIHYLDWLENNKEINDSNDIIQAEISEPLDSDNKIYTIKMLNSDEEEIVVGSKHTGVDNNSSKLNEEIKFDNILPMKKKLDTNINNSNIFIKEKIIVETDLELESGSEAEFDEEICFEDFEVFK